MVENAERNKKGVIKRQVAVCSVFCSVILFTLEGLKANLVTLVLEFLEMSVFSG